MIETPLPTDHPSPKRDAFASWTDWTLALAKWVIEREDADDMSPGRLACVFDVVEFEAKREFSPNPSPAPEVMGTPSDLVAEAFVPVYNAIDILQEKLLYLVSPEATPNALNDALLLLRRVCVRVAHKKDLNDVAKQIQDWLGRNDHNSIVRMAGVQDEACPDCEGVHSPKVNISFVQPATGKGESTFWCPQCLSIQLIFDWNDGSMLCNECKFQGNVNKFLFTVPPEKK